MDDPGGTPISDKCTFADVRTLLQANLTAAAITVAAANTSALVSTGYSLTGSDATSMIDLAGTWNTTGTPTALKLNVTDTASNAASLLMDLQVGGASKLSLRKDGLTVAPYFWASTSTKGGTSELGTNYLKMGGINFITRNESTGTVTFETNAGEFTFAPVGDIIDVRRTTNAQAFRVYNTWGSSGANYERVVLDAGKTTSSVHRLLSEAGGTGTIRPIAIDAYAMAGAPTATELPSGTWGVFKDSSGGSPGNVVIAYNDEGNILTASLT